MSHLCPSAVRRIKELLRWEEIPPMKSAAVAGLNLGDDQSQESYSTTENGSRGA